jgi:hypothetical protein
MLHPNGILTHPAKNDLVLISPMSFAYSDHAIGCLEHIADVRSACWIGEHSGLQIISREAMANERTNNQTFQSQATWLDRRRKLQNLALTVGA